MYPELEGDGLGILIIPVIIMISMYFSFMIYQNHVFLNKNIKVVKSISQCDQFGWCLATFEDGTSRVAAFPQLGDTIPYFHN